MKHLVGKEVTKEVDFMEEKVSIRKLTFGQIIELQKQIKAVQTKPKSKKNEEVDSMELLRIVIGAGVIGAQELSVEDYQSFPPDELNNLATEVLNYIGLSTDAVEVDPDSDVDGETPMGN